MHILNSAALGAATHPQHPELSSSPPASAAATLGTAPTPSSKMARVPRLGGTDTMLLNSLVFEAEQCAHAMNDLAHLRRHTVPERHRADLARTYDRMREARSALLALADSFPLCVAQAFKVLSHVEMALQCLGRTVRDVRRWCADVAISRSQRWVMLSSAMMAQDEGRGTLEGRFRTYARFFGCLVLLLSRSPEFDKFRAETFRLQIMDLRKARGIKMPKVPTTTFYPFEDPSPAMPPVGRHIHWSEDILADPMPAKTPFGIEGRSESYGPFLAWDELNIHSYSRPLFRKTVKQDEMSLTLFMNPYDHRFYFLLRCNYKSSPYFSVQAVQDLHVTRSGSAGTTLRLSRWSASQRGYKYWAVMHLNTYEELIVLYCTILSLKFRASPPVLPSPDELHFASEDRLWKTYILDNESRHKLSLYKDHVTGAKRLHAVAAEGPLARCPAWTIFLTNPITNAHGRVRQTTSNTAVVYDAVLYIFGENYRSHLAMRPRFEITFYRRDDCASFVRLFQR